MAQLKEPEYVMTGEKKIPRKILDLISRMSARISRLEELMRKQAEAKQHNGKD